MKRPDNFSTFHELRGKFPFFSYDSFDYHFDGNTLEINYSFNLSDQFLFSPRVRIPFKDKLFRPFDSLSNKALENLVFHAGMIEMISYWKAACPPKIIIKPFMLNDSRLKFWKKIYFQGLGEFFYINSIDASEDDFMELICLEGEEPAQFPVIAAGGSLIPVGGGKDSAVSMGLLNKNFENWLPFVINPRKTTREVIQAAGSNEEDTVVFYRDIDPQLLKLNREGFLNGHTPFSALLAFYSLLAAYLTGRTDIILSNESSASEVTVPGTNINHQYSKSLEFERDFRDYTREHISPDFNYFSLLRPLSELQIAGLFARMPEFLDHFKSCNVGSKTDTWCGACPKCLFTFIILSPYVKPGVLTGIFGKNLLDDPSLENTFEQLSGKQEIKPFECIGTVSEVKQAMDMAAKMYNEDEMPYLLRVHLKESSGGINGMATPASTVTMDTEHFVPEKYFNLLEKALR